MPTFNISEYVLGSFHQGNSRFGRTAGTQCACNSLFAIFLSNIRNVTLWSKNDLDTILIEGDCIYKSLNTNDFLAADELPRSLNFGGLQTNVEYLELLTGVATLVPNFPFLRANFQNLNNGCQCLMFVSGFTIALFKSPLVDSCYLFDSHSRDERGLSVSDGQSVLLRFSSLLQLELYIQVLYLEYQDKETTYFQLQFVKINIQDDVRSIALQIFNGYLLRASREQQTQSQNYETSTNKINCKKKSGFKITKKK